MSSDAPPVPAPGFSWSDAPWGVQLRADALLPFTHGWTTRQLQLRGTPEIESAGWTQVAEAGGVPESALVRLRQVHGRAVIHADGPRAAAAAPEADAAVSRDPSLLVTVQVADCVPLLLASPASRSVAAVHAGWRGTAAGVAESAVTALVIGCGARVADLRAAVGPSIGPCCYEVGDELRATFEATRWSAGQVARWFQRRGDRWYLDLWRATADQLAELGVPGPSIHLSRLCTMCHPDWFCSYRREGAGTGRLAAYIRAAPVAHAE